ncbi:gamma carbonic anhydrase family protein [Verminephrobacter aporrectodeae subsp. tuberculatae]|uniref:gamma carbonic anhydrase family protein n=1 Tax=Verminephrobacter aporrectodeae TaxID=1110389 RepID=UPI002243F61B|nr:gamma carbonic anhydrase family protein [Verminephrobacter aporrectodeae]MCW8197503.1 gamma carbonic anhydrase family protein [Verminephrobacter aporrectodeae subsp. tuberculatae]
MNSRTRRSARANIHPSAHVAETAVLDGAVTVGPQAVICHGAVLVAEGGCISVGHSSIVMENSVLRSTSFADCTLGNNVLVGPHCHLSGCQIEDEVFVATGVSIFNGAHVGQGAELRINAVVHLSTRVPCGATVPIGWVAVGDPAQILPPDQHDAIWAVQKGLDFPMKVFGVDRQAAAQDSVVKRITERYAQFLLRRNKGS